jgi:hypothetical protein
MSDAVATQPGESGSEAWREGGPGVRLTCELNLRVSPELEAIIPRLLAIGSDAPRGFPRLAPGAPGRRAGAPRRGRPDSLCPGQLRPHASGQQLPVGGDDVVPAVHVEVALHAQGRVRGVGGREHVEERVDPAGQRDGRGHVIGAAAEEAQQQVDQLADDILRDAGEQRGPGRVGGRRGLVRQVVGGRALCFVGQLRDGVRQAPLSISASMMVAWHVFGHCALSFRLKTSRGLVSL